MTPAARIAAAIEIMNEILTGAPAERALTRWARASRYAGSGDRNAVRDHVFDGLRRKRSAAFVGGAETGRGIMLGLLRMDGADVEALFSDLGHAPAKLSADEAANGADIMAAPLQVRLDQPDWLWPEMVASFEGADAAKNAAEALRHRAPVYVRVNLSMGSRDDAVRALAEADIGAVAHSSVKTAIMITRNPRRVKNAAPYLSGLIELQDAASQAAVLRLPLAGGQSVLDYCAGGGGKALAVAGLAGARFADNPVRVVAHDVAPQRMADLPARALRGGHTVTLASMEELAAQVFDLVLVDAPCSGSGTWRRAPDAKWRLTPERLAELKALQQSILQDAAQLVRPGGWLAYATCSLLAGENTAQIAAFLAANPSWQCKDEMRLVPGSEGDGFYLAVIQRGT